MCQNRILFKDKNFTILRKLESHQHRTLKKAQIKHNIIWGKACLSVASSYCIKITYSCSSIHYWTFLDEEYLSQNSLGELWRQSNMKYNLTAGYHLKMQGRREKNWYKAKWEASYSFYLPFLLFLLSVFLESSSLPRKVFLQPFSSHYPVTGFRFSEGCGIVKSADTKLSKASSRQWEVNNLKLRHLKAPMERRKGPLRFGKTVT